MDWDALKIGEEIPAFERTTDLSHWNRYAAVNDEFIPIHMDPEAAHAVGQKDVFGMGNLRVSYLHDALRGWLGPGGDIVEFDCEFRGFNYRGDRLVSRGRITGKEEREGAKLVHLDLAVDNQEGQNTCPGTATVLLFEGGNAQVLPAPAPEGPSGQASPGVYLDQATIDRIGETTEPAQALPIGANEIRRWAMAVYYPEPPPMEFYDEEVAGRGPWGGLIAPREFNPFAFVLDVPMGAPWMRGMGTEPGTRVLNAGQRNLYFEPMRPGDRIRTTRRLVDAYEKEGRLGTMLFLITENRWTNQRGELARLFFQTTIYY